MNDTVVLEGEFGMFIDTGQSSAVIESLSVTENGTYTASGNVDGYSPVTVNVPAPEPVTESLSVTANGTYTPEQGVDGFDSVSVAVPATVPVISSLTVSEDGTYTAPSGTDGYSPVTVNTGVAALQAEIESAETISGCDPLVSGLTALVTYSNGITEESDTTVSECIATLASGYGGGSQSISGTYTLSENSETITITHDFGVIPTFALIYLSDEYTKTSYHAVSASIVSNIPSNLTYSTTSGMHQTLVENAGGTTRVLSSVNNDEATTSSVTFGSRNASTGWIAGNYHYYIVA